MRSTGVFRQFEQVNCPNKECGKIILSPEISFNKADDRIKERYGQCCWCGRMVLFKIGRVTPITAELGPIPVDMKEGVTINSSPGVAFVTQLVIVFWPNRLEYEVRVGVAILGNTNFESSVGANPFDPNFHDNFVSGKGVTVDEAIINLDKEIASLLSTLHH